MSAHPSFSATRIFITLFILTAVEVTWSFLPFPAGGWGKAALWGGLLIFAFWKGLLIFTYFMHMKFEGWVVKALIAPTPVLIAVVLFALMPDVSNNSLLIEPVGAQLDVETGEVLQEMSETDGEHGAESGDGENHGDDQGGGEGH